MPSQKYVDGTKRVYVVQHFQRLTQGNIIKQERERERDDLPLLGRDNLCVPCLLEGVDLSLGLLRDLEPRAGFELASSTKSSRFGLDFGLLTNAAGVSCVLADTFGEELHPSESDAAAFSFDFELLLE